MGISFSSSTDQSNDSILTKTINNWDTSLSFSYSVVNEQNVNDVLKYLYIRKDMSDGDNKIIVNPPGVLEALIFYKKRILVLTNEGKYVLLEYCNIKPWNPLQKVKLTMLDGTVCYSNQTVEMLENTMDPVFKQERLMQSAEFEKLPKETRDWILEYFEHNHQ